MPPLLGTVLEHVLPPAEVGKGNFAVRNIRGGRLNDEIPPHGTLARIRQKVAADRWAGTGAEAQAKVDAR